MFKRKKSLFSTRNVILVFVLLVLANYLLKIFGIDLSSLKKNIPGTTRQTGVMRKDDENINKSEDEDDDEDDDEIA